MKMILPREENENQTVKIQEAKHNVMQDMTLAEKQLDSPTVPEIRPGYYTLLLKRTKETSFALTL